ncbi:MULTISPECIES: OPT/YSL family transporter [unclassified Brenneria]|uniref:OPT/YSL family transporter n=1 Tax=unclassified Brenneria TaxID=2634434 RepID=UPI001553CF4A|nr:MULTISPECIES: OPT/YSL family transporter [unclassified Brenneria]MBJ7220534.1 OPT/YSL family transporter [Brenneria sp. L3-3C-1]MEE3641778.1 OPT/YSL family transporter [Brenneria sp. L3_3C_1]MEE3649592.1 OPT/YSL family transporter [Brenneria sp. HEZEL_4_2_4]NPC99550.1 OPT family oligopeptide transporter [Brenneria sp. hezel4-2-4]
MSDHSSLHQTNHPGKEKKPHHASFNPLTLVFLVILSLFGAVIGIQLLTTLGVTPNTSIIGALIAMIIARVPLQLLRRFRSIHVQNLAQTAISSATFGAANSLLLPISVLWLFGRPDLVVPVFIGVSLAMLLDAFLLYRMFNTSVFPATGTWPPGVAAAESIKAGDRGGSQAAILSAGVAIGAIGSWFKLPMAALGTAFIGNIWALTMFGIGLLLRGYSQPILGIDINKNYIPHGMMIGAGLVALVQVVMLIRGKKTTQTVLSAAALKAANDDRRHILSALRMGAIGYIVLAMLIAAGTGLYSEMSIVMLLAFILYAAFAAFIHELIVGLAAMHSGWFPAFAVALITLIIGMMIGFPLLALAVLCAFSVATGPAFADMGYDLKAGFILRDNGADPAFELEGRRQQLFAAMIAFIIAIPVVYFSYQSYFQNNLVPPVAKVYVATIQAGVSMDIAKSLMIWAVPGALIQWLGGSKRQLGVLLATGLLITNPLAGWAVLLGITLRLLVIKVGGEEMRNRMEVFAAGLIAGDAIFNFFNSILASKIGGK